MEERGVTECDTGSAADDDALLQIYNRDLMALSAEVAQPKYLPHADAKATAVSAVCGSEVTVEFALDGEKITGFGYAVEACSLTKAVVAIMSHAAIGKERSEIARASAELRAMMEEGGPVPGGDWAALKILVPIISYKSRHDTVMLPFVAVEKAFAEKE